MTALAPLHPSLEDAARSNSRRGGGTADWRPVSASPTPQAGSTERCGRSGRLGLEWWMLTGECKAAALEVNRPHSSASAAGDRRGARPRTRPPVVEHLAGSGQNQRGHGGRWPQTTLRPWRWPMWASRIGKPFWNRCGDRRQRHHPAQWRICAAIDNASSSARGDGEHGRQKPLLRLRLQHRPAIFPGKPRAVPLHRLAAEPR